MELTTARRRHAHRLEHGADVLTLLALELLERLAHPAVHVGAVVAVADRRVEPDEVHPVLGDLGGEPADPVDRLLVCHAPHRSAGVSTGASQSRVSSSSSLSSVIEQPAISSDVM